MRSPAITTDAAPPAKPRLRGVSHHYAAFVAAGLGVALVLTAPSAPAAIAAAIYALSVLALFATSATYHRIDWDTVRARRRMKRLDHAMIFVLIAGTNTPIALLVLHGTIQVVDIAVVWGGALVGVVLKLAWIDAPKWLSPVIYIGLGWAGAIATGQMGSVLGALPVIGIAAGGVLYTIGGVIYGLERPNPVPGVFGYHEVFHALVCAAAACHYAVIAFAVVPHG